MPQVVVCSAGQSGSGIFAVDNIDPEVVIRELIIAREVTGDSPLRPDGGERLDHCTVIDGRLYLVGPPDCYLNHSCDPNAYLRFSARIELVARRRITSGSEITIDYLINNAGGQSWPCRCRSSRCRGDTAASFFALPLEIQREYLPLLAPWFLKRYAGELKHLEAPVHVVPYDPAWPELFARERASLEHTLAPWLAGPIEHVGSTAVPGLVAKPVIDIMAAVGSLPASRPAVAALVAAGYVYLPYKAEVMHWFCRPSLAFRTHHLHLVPVNTQLWVERLAFRDYLRCDSRVALEYADLKRRLATEYEFDREAYTNAKGPFVERVVALALSSGSGG